MAEYEVEIRPKSSGFDTFFGIVVLILIVSLVVSCGNFGGSSTTKEAPPQVKDGKVVTSEAQGKAEPCYLAKLHVYGDHSDVVGNIENSGSVIDSYGKEYKAPYFDLCSYGKNGSYNAVQAYTDLVTDGKYMYLEGTYFCRQNQNETHTITFQIYADGKLVYDSGEISRSTKATYFKVCIDNADIVRVTSFSNDYSSKKNPGVILAEAVVYN